MPRWGGIQPAPATFGTKVRKMNKHISGDGRINRVPDAKPEPVPLPDQPAPKRRPSKTRAQAWAKIDAGKGTWKPK
jgi:hypothetical protein